MRTSLCSEVIISIDYHTNIPETHAKINYTFQPAWEGADMDDEEQVPKARIPKETPDEKIVRLQQERDQLNNRIRKISSKKTEAARKARNRYLIQFGIAVEMAVKNGTMSISDASGLLTRHLSERGQGIALAALKSLTPSPRERQAVSGSRSSRT